MTELLLFLILGLLALCLIGAVCGLVELVLGWLDRLAEWWRRRAGRDPHRLSEEWRRHSDKQQKEDK